VGYTTSGLNSAVDGVAAAATYISFHTSDPTTVGDHEVTGGSPAYARVQTTWATASGGSRVGSQVTANIPASTSVTHWGLWTASTGGTFKYGGALDATETFGSQGTLLHTPTLTATN
jgi:hypothetical protein